MADEFGEFSERQPRSKPVAMGDFMTLEKAVEMGEYRPEYLSTFPQWASLNSYLRWSLIRQAIKNRRRFLTANYAETFNILDFSLKPEMKKVMKNIEKQIEDLQKDEERLRLEYMGGEK